MVFLYTLNTVTSRDSRFDIREARPGTGLGLFARVPISKGDFILEYTGVSIPTATSDESSSRYLFEIDDEITLDGDTNENTAKYINHDCYPSTEAEIEDKKIMIYATRDIGEGEELTIDYDTEYFDEFIRPHGCKCASCEKGIISPYVKVANANQPS